MTLLHQAKRNIDNLSTICKFAIPPPFATLRTMVEHASGVVDDLNYFVWKSDLFKWYIFQYQSQTIRKRYIELRRPFYSAPKSECDVAEAAPFADYQPSLTEDSDDGGDEAEVDDFPTEYEILEDNLKPLHPDRGTLRTIGCALLLQPYTNLKTTYSIVAPSKRCCLICATIMASLSREHGGPIIQTLTKHQYIFPTALPCGLPESIRRRLISHYKQRLTTVLNAIVPTASTAPGLSIQSQPLSVGSGDEGDELSKIAEAQRSNTQRWLKAWFLDTEPERMEKWTNM